MCNTKRKYQATIMSAVDELQRCYRALNKLYYNGVLEDVIITIQSDVKRSAYAWISVAKVWKDNTETSYHEINIVAEYLNRDPTEVVASLLHEMAHLYNMQQGVQDVSRGGQYHNTHFKFAAETHGLTCEHNKTYGWTITKATDQTAEWVKQNVRTGCFRMNRSQVWADGKPKTVSGEDDNGKPAVTKKGGSNIRKYICPDCGLIIRASRNIDGKVKCIECDKVMEFSK